MARLQTPQKRCSDHLDVLSHLGPPLLSVLSLPALGCGQTAARSVPCMKFVRAYLRRRHGLGSAVSLLSAQMNYSIVSVVY
jgi:hypothetical protein